MSNNVPLKSSRFSLTNASVSSFLLVNGFVWYLCAFKFLQDTINLKGISSDLSLLVIGVNFLAFIFFGFLTTWLINRFSDRKKWLKYWLIAGLFVSAIFFFLNSADFITLTLLGCTIGAYFGLGMPVVAGYFTACTEPKNRAKFGGAVILLLVVSVPTLTIIGASETYLTPLVLGLWLVIGLGLLSFKAPESKAEPKNRASFRSIFSNRSFLLYILPWLMFSLINDLASQVISNSFSGFPSFFSQGYVVFTNVLAGICALAFGFLADKKGRKRLALVGFALLGTAYAALGLFNGNYAVAWFYAITDGVAWGAFTMLFITTLWGDISQGKNGEKYYLLGILPYLFSVFAGDSMGAYLAQNNLISETTVFSFAAFFLFAATLPLFYAPETLPEKVIKDLDIMSYVEKAKKKADEGTKKTRKEDNSNTSIEDDKSYEEARKLAEKYY